MANCHALFQDFNGTIRLTESRRRTLLSARNDLRSRINNDFIENESRLPTVHQIQFQTQGSFIMDTIVNPISEDYDLDDGVYLIGTAARANRPEPKLFHNFVLQSISRNNPHVKEVKDKDTCVRALYKEGYSFLFESKTDRLSKGFHVDLPIYYSNTKRSPDLAHLKDSWIVSDPIKFIKWFEDKVSSNFKEEFLYEKRQFATEYQTWRDQIRKDDAQLRKIVRYLKAWCDFKGKDMPCGIVLTILAANNYSKNERDDISFKDTLLRIKETLDREFVCRRPTVPLGEDLLVGYDHEAYFKKCLGEFVESAKQAINETNPKRACAKWQLHLGGRFSCTNALDLDENAASIGSPAIITGNAKSA